MPIEKTDIGEFIERSKSFPVLDVRSPAEYAHAHFPGAYSLPIFNNEQRAAIGTAYKQQGRAVAVDIGLSYFSEEMKSVQKKALEIFEAHEGEGLPTFVVHCWRGGMRSGAIAWLLSLYGYKVYVLDGGYKSFRRWVLDQFEKKYLFSLLGGFTGSGKTELLYELEKQGKKIIDLERLANHKGSAFGALGMEKQPSQEMFENRLAIKLWEASKTATGDPIWLEDESRHIGIVHIPNTMWEQMRSSQLYFLEIPQEERLEYITGEYGKFSTAELSACVLKIQKRLGGLETQNAVNHLKNNEIKECFAILLRYYDKLYQHSLMNRENISQILHKVPCKSVSSTNSLALDPTG
ncbi:MAG: tRNA 2-selenouridine(34) synthase MnmH [Chitinophagaceae bacterium]|nr:tRNA 2-selenouridine(34) synthase MnmH [Chitinophagaceae bacterium]